MKSFSAPELLNINGTIQTEGVLQIRVLRDSRTIPFPDYLVFNRIRIRLVKDINGEKRKQEWETISDDTTATITLPIKEYENGQYEIEIQSYQFDDDKKLVSKSEKLIEKFVILNSGVPAITRLNTVQFEEYLNQNIGITDQAFWKYLDAIIYGRPQSMILNGLFLMYYIGDSEEGLYHKSLVSIERNGELLPEDYQFVFPTNVISSDCYIDEEQQVSGNKYGILFVPIEIRDYDKIRVKVKLSEYSEPDMKVLLDEKVSMLSLTDFFDYAYVSLGKEEPQIVFSELKKERSTGQEIKVVFNNVNLSRQNCCIKKTKNGADEEQIEVSQRETSIKLFEPGEYKIKASIFNNSSEEELITREKKYKIYQPTPFKCEYCKIVKSKENLIIKLEISPFEKIAKAYYEIKGYEEKERIVLLEEDNKYYADLLINTDNLPKGLHIILFNLCYSDGTAENKSLTFLISDDERRVEYFE